MAPWPLDSACCEGGLHYNQCNEEEIGSLRSGEERETPTSTPKELQLGFKPSWDSELGQRRP